MANKLDSLTTMTNNAIGNYHERTDEHNMKLLDESYQFSFREKDNLTTRYNTDVFNLISVVYANQYDEEDQTHWRTNENVELVQSFLNDTGHSKLDVDGMYGKETQKAMKNYLNEFSGKHMWEEMKSGIEKIWEPGEDIEDPSFYDWK